MSKLTYNRPDRTINHSDIYQHKFQEIPVDFSMEENYALLEKESEEILFSKYNIEDIYTLIPLLTEKQRTVLNLWLAGFSQNAIAKILHTQQSTVYKYLYGNPYTPKRTGKKRKYGGILAKLRNLYHEKYEMIIDDVKQNVIELKQKAPSQKVTRPNVPPAKVISLREYKKLYRKRTT